MENSIRVNSWNSWPFLLATNSTNFTKTFEIQFFTASPAALLDSHFF